MIQMQLVPSKFFTTSGAAVSAVSDLNAFDLALKEAGIEEQNLVAVSSVIPDGAEAVEYTKLPMGAITHCVLAQMRGKGGDIVSAGIAHTFRKDGHGGYVAEGHIYGNAEALRKELGRKIKEMERIRGIELEEPTIIVREVKVPEGQYGCALASLVFCEYQ